LHQIQKRLVPFRTETIVELPAQLGNQRFVLFFMVIRLGVVSRFAAVSAFCYSLRQYNSIKTPPHPVEIAQNCGKTGGIF
jgi:hypothetical protein